MGSRYTDENIAWLVQEVHNLQKVVMNHKLAINELGERENEMSAEFDVANEKFDAYAANVSTAVTNLKTLASDFQVQVSALAGQVAALTAELGHPNEDTAKLVELAAKIQKATDDLAVAVSV